MYTKLCPSQLYRTELTHILTSFVAFIRRSNQDVIDPTNFPAEDIPDANFVLSSLSGYFANKFGFNELETTIIMGAHNLGGARRDESGYTGMWVQGKNDFDIQYYENMFHPTPLDCSASKQSDDINGPNGCDHLEEKGLCDVDGTGNRCMGWEHIEIKSRDENDQIVKKFQWRHSCDGNGNRCTHIMLNADMTLLRDFDAYIDAETGQVSFPQDYVPQHDDAPTDCGKPDPATGRIRIFATCFPQRETTSRDVVEEYSVDDVSPHTERDDFIDEFGRLFDIMISHVNATTTPLAELEIIPRKPKPSINQKQPCPIGEAWCEYKEGGPNPFQCTQCRTGYCATEKSTGKALCQKKTYKPDMWAKGAVCDPGICPKPKSTGNKRKVTYACSNCVTKFCVYIRNGVAKCKGNKNGGKRPGGGRRPGMKRPRGGGRAKRGGGD